jgi:hypothetical protein
MARKELRAEEVGNFARAWKNAKNSISDKQKRLEYVAK